MRKKSFEKCPESDVRVGEIGVSEMALGDRARFIRALEKVLLGGSLVVWCHGWSSGGPVAGGGGGGVL